ncbi:MAG: hypothetical protein F9K35_21470, partial [Burkholderiaceae bacterium]
MDHPVDEGRFGRGLHEGTLLVELERGLQFGKPFFEHPKVELEQVILAQVALHLLKGLNDEQAGLAALW